MSINARYEALIAAGKIERDPAQEAVVAKLARLQARIGFHRKARNSSLLGFLFRRREYRPAPFKGLYIYGAVGRGKTMLMDIFFETTPARRKRRVHFHEFMLDVHERLNVCRQKMKAGEIRDQDPIRIVAEELVNEAWLLCFDEFHVTDIADAMILARLFTQLFDLGVIVVATSNLPPSDLYKDGLNRGLFLPFVAILQEHMDVVALDARTDFRLEKLTGLPVWYVPADAKAAAALETAWQQLTGNHVSRQQVLTIKGRKLVVPKAAMGVAWFSFSELCGQPLGAADYLKIAQDFHTLILDHIPVMDFDRRNEAKRFIILIDTLYDHAVKLIASAAAEPDALYTASDGYEAQEFSRTASRLIEMRSQSYLGLPHGARDPLRAPVSEADIVET